MNLIKRVGTTGVIILSAVLILIVSFFFPYFNSSREINTVLTVSTFLFGIFAGFVIASRLSRYSRYRELLTDETGYLIAFCKYAYMISDNFGRKITELVDRYLLESFLYEVYESHNKTEVQFYNFIDGIKDHEKFNSDQNTVFTNMVYMMKDILKDRNELYVLGKDRISFWLKSTLVLLAGIILYTLFLLREQTIYSFVITILLSCSVLIVLALIRDLDKLKLHNETISYGIYYRVFDAIGKPRIYTNESLSRGIIPLKDSTYRFSEIVRKGDAVRYKKMTLMGTKRK